jgi:hypothetical protein
MTGLLASMEATPDLEAFQLKGSLRRQPRFDRFGTVFCFSLQVEACFFQLCEVHFPEKRRSQKKGLVDVHPGHSFTAL